jgi:photosystem II CP43 chlorophyll apoprotein
MKVCGLGWLLRINPTKTLFSLKKFYLVVMLCN